MFFYLTDVLLCLEVFPLFFAEDVVELVPVYAVHQNRGGFHVTFALLEGVYLLEFGDYLKYLHLHVLRTIVSQLSRVTLRIHNSLDQLQDIVTLICKNLTFGVFWLFFIRFRFHLLIRSF